MMKNFLLLALVVGLLGAVLLGSDLVKIYSMPGEQITELDREELPLLSHQEPLLSQEERTQRLSKRLDLDSRWFEQLSFSRRLPRGQESEPIAKANTDIHHGVEQGAKADTENT